MSERYLDVGGQLQCKAVMPKILCVDGMMVIYRMARASMGLCDHYQSCSSRAVLDLIIKNLRPYLHSQLRTFSSKGIDLITYACAVLEHEGISIEVRILYPLLIHSMQCGLTPENA